jgi:DNA mismatch repair protein MutL
VWLACSNRLDRVASVLSEDEASALVSAEAETEAGHLHALVSVPDRTRPNANGIYLFVNGRPIRDLTLRHALLQVYRDLLPRGRFPSGLLFLTVPPESVDVNVHPAKWEVRFADPQALHQLVRRTVRGAIEGRVWLGAQDSNVEPQSHLGRGAKSGTGASESRVEDRSGGLNDWIFAGREATPAAGQGASDTLQFRNLESAREPEEGARPYFGELRLLGQLLASYLLVESAGGLLLVDQHAAHERVLYERLRAQWLENGVERQGLLIASHLELGAAGVALLAADGGLLSRLGFDVEAFGEDTVVIRSVPGLLSGRDPGNLVKELALELSEGDGLLDADSGASETRLLQAADRMFASLACHSARRAGDHLEPAEQRSLLTELDTIPWAATCPHGRPVAISLDRAEIEQRFRRR